MNWIDFCILAVLGITAFSGLKKGLVVSFFNMISMIVAILVARSYYSTLTVLLVDKTSIEESIMKFLIEKKIFSGFSMGLPEGISPAFAGDQLISNLHYFITMLIMNAISIIVIYFGVRLLLSIAEGFLKGTTELPVLKEVNGLGGAAIGLAKGVIILLIVFALIIPISNIQTWTGLRNGIEGSMLAKYFYNYNFILGWIWNSAYELIK
ncbi:MAG: CvpA family protein [Bacillota bacterium]